MAEDWRQWRILVDPISDNGATEAKKNKGGMRVVLKRPGSYETSEVARVAYERKNSTHPDVSFADQLAVVVAAARAALDTLRESLTWDGEYQ